MFKTAIKIFEVSRGELPGSSRKVIGWGKFLTPRLVEYDKAERIFYWGKPYVCSVDYWIEYKVLEKSINENKTGSKGRS